MFRKIITKVSLLTLIVSLTMIGTANATVTKLSDTATSRFTYISSLELGFDIRSDGEVIANADLEQYVGDNCKAVIKIQEYRGYWATISTDTETGTYDAIAGTSYQARKGYNYRAIAYGYVYVNGSLVESAVEYGPSEYY